MIRESRSRGGSAVLRSALLAMLASLPSSSMALPVPSPDQSVAPACITLVGSNRTQASAMGTFIVQVRDLANSPFPGASVVVDLSSAPDMHFCEEQLMAGVEVNCAARTARAFADANGDVTFTLLGGSNGDGNAVTLLNGGRIYANGALIKTPTVSAFDLDGQGGVGANDLSAWLGDFASGNPYGRSDYDCSGALGANDFSFWLSVFGSGTQFVSCATSCP